MQMQIEQTTADLEGRAQLKRRIKLAERRRRRETIEFDEDLLTSHLNSSLWQSKDSNLKSLFVCIGDQRIPNWTNAEAVFYASSFLLLTTANTSQK